MDGTDSERRRPEGADTRSATGGGSSSPTVSFIIFNDILNKRRHPELGSGSFFYITY